MTKARQLADLISSGSIETAEITSLDAAKLTGSIADARVPASAVTQHANNYVHPNHSGEVTSTADGATVIADNIIDEANLKVSNTPTNGYMLTAQSGNTGGLTWADAPSGGLVPLTQSSGTSGTDNVIVNGWISDTYEDYLMTYQINVETTGADLNMTLYDASGNISSGNEYDSAHIGVDTGGSTQTRCNSGQNNFRLSHGMNNDSGRISITGQMRWLHPRKSGKRTTILHDSRMLNNSATVRSQTGVLEFKATNALTGFYMNATADQIDYWQIRCYGIVNS